MHQPITFTYLFDVVVETNFLSISASSGNNVLECRALKAIRSAGCAVLCIIACADLSGCHCIQTYSYGTLCIALRTWESTCKHCIGDI